MKYLCIICLMICIPCVAVAEQQKHHLRLGYIEFEPYTYTDENGRPAGILVDLAADVYPKAGYTWEASSYPVKRLIEYLVSGELDIWMGLKTLPQFKGTMHIGNAIVASLDLNAYTVDNHPPVLKKEDLSGKSVIILRGYSYGGWVNYIKSPENKVTFIKANKHTSALKMLKARRADYLLDYQEPVDRALKDVSMPELKLNAISSLPCYFIVSGQRTDGPEIIERLEKAFRTGKSIQ